MHELCFFHTCPSLGVKRVTGDGFITRGAVMFIALIIVILQTSSLPWFEWTCHAGCHTSVTSALVVVHVTSENQSLCVVQ